MKIQKDDVRLMQFVLDEISETDRAVILQALKDQPELKAEIDNLKKLVGDLETALSTPDHLQLKVEQKKDLFARTIYAASSEKSGSSFFARWRWLMGGLTAAAFSVLIFNKSLQQEAHRSMVIDEGSNISKSAPVQQSAPVLADVPAGPEAVANQALKEEEILSDKNENRIVEAKKIPMHAEAKGSFAKEVSRKRTEPGFKDMDLAEAKAKPSAVALQRDAFMNDGAVSGGGSGSAMGSSFNSSASYGKAAKMAVRAESAPAAPSAALETTSAEEAAQEQDMKADAQGPASKSLSIIQLSKVGPRLTDIELKAVETILKNCSIEQYINEKNLRLTYNPETQLVSTDIKISDSATNCLKMGFEKLAWPHSKEVIFKIQNDSK